MVRHPLEITDSGIIIQWDKYIKLSTFNVRIESLPSQEIEEMKKAVQEVKEYVKVARTEIEE
jgi:hypothetical protein